MKQILALVALMTLLMTLFITAALADDSLFNEPGTYPICKETQTITVGIKQNTNVTSYEDNKFTKWLEEKANVKFEFVYFTQADANQKLEIMISSGAELPDVLCGFDLSESAIYTYGSQGIFQPLNEYTDTIGVGMQEAFERVDNKNLRKMMTSADGNIYYMPRYNEQIGNMWQLRSWINKTWLDNLGLEVPSTTDELYTVLKAFAEQDPNGNGINDEVPFVGASGIKQQAADFIANAFIYNDMTDRWVVTDGKLDVNYNKPEWREALRYMNKLCSENLLSTLTFTMDEAQLKQLLASGDGVSVVGAFTSNSFGVMPNDERRLEYVPLPPLTGPEGVSWAARFAFTPTSRYIITRDCKNPELAYRIADLMVTREASIFGRWGEDGVDWVQPQEGDKCMLEDLGFEPTIVPILEFGIPQNSHWFMSHAFVLELGLNDGQTSSNDDPLYSERWVSYSLPYYIGKAPAETVEMLKLTAEEEETIKDIRSTLNSFVNEYIAAFVTGAADIESEWDAYVKELDNIGLEKYISICQAAYDRAKTAE